MKLTARQGIYTRNGVCLVPSLSKETYMITDYYYYYYILLLLGQRTPANLTYSCVCVYVLIYIKDMTHLHKSHGSFT